MTDCVKRAAAITIAVLVLSSVVACDIFSTGEGFNTLGTTGVIHFKISAAQEAEGRMAGYLVIPAGADPANTNQHLAAGTLPVLDGLASGVARKPWSDEEAKFTLGKELELFLVVDMDSSNVPVVAGRGDFLVEHYPLVVTEFQTIEITLAEMNVYNGIRVSLAGAFSCNGREARLSVTARGADPGIQDNVQARGLCVVSNGSASCFLRTLDGGGAPGAVVQTWDEGSQLDIHCFVDANSNAGWTPDGGDYYLVQPLERSMTRYLRESILFSDLELK